MPGRGNSNFDTLALLSDEERPAAQDSPVGQLAATAAPRRHLKKAAAVALALAAGLAVAATATGSSKAGRNPTSQSARQSIISEIEVTGDAPAVASEAVVAPPAAGDAAAAPAAAAEDAPPAGTETTAAKPAVAAEDAPPAAAEPVAPAAPAVAVEAPAAAADADAAPAAAADVEAPAAGAPAAAADADAAPAADDEPAAGADFDCDAGYSNWEAGWSPNKQKFCCEKFQKACKEDTALADQGEAKPSEGPVPNCKPGNEFCPDEWETGKTGGFYCPKDDGCRVAADGAFDPDVCPDQCVIGVVPAEAFDILTKKEEEVEEPAEEPETKPDEETKDDDKSDEKKEEPKEEDDKKKKKKPSHPKQTKEDNNGIDFCPDDTEDCPPDWRDGPEGGYLCLKGEQTGACQQWKSGPFDSKTCEEFCSIGYMPTTKTTITKTTTTTKAYEYPALMCYSVARYGEELDILNFQHDHEAGIFACDETIVFADDAGEMNGGFPLTELPVKTGSGGGASKDGTAANTEVFLMAWQGIRDCGLLDKVDWVIKVDPDAVLLPDRARIQLEEATGSPTYVKNCNKYDGPDWPLMFGAAEAVSQQALWIYFDGEETCKSELTEWQTWGEDYFLSHCLDHLGVNAFLDTDIIGDNLCLGADCSQGSKAAFHPFKSIGAWQECWLTATGQTGGDGGDEGGEGGEEWQE